MCDVISYEISDVVNFSFYYIPHYIRSKEVKDLEYNRLYVCPGRQ